MNSSLLARCLGCALFGVAWSAAALTPAEVQKQLSAGKSLTFVDLRSRSAFEAGHIPNAIHVPASLVAQKELPELGTVIVYDDGLGVDAATPAAATLNQKRGITAYPLEGGFAAWESAQSAASTRAPGLTPEELPMITYQVLKQAESNNVVLVDLRKPAAPSPASAAKPDAPAALTDLAAEFPHAQIAKSPFETQARKLVNGGAAPPPLLVLIDSGDGTAQQMARTLKANGIKRFAILAGGEEMIVRKGQSGLNRVGSSIVVEQPGAKNPTK